MHVRRAMDKPSITIESLSREERLDLLELLWDSLSRNPAGVPVSGEQLAELSRRSDELDEDVAKRRALGVPWDEVTRQFRARR